MKLTAVGRDVLRGHDEVALVLPVRVVHDNDHAALANVSAHGLDAIETLCHNPRETYRMERQTPATKRYAVKRLLPLP
jgi:hypothetical protein